MTNSNYGSFYNCKFKAPQEGDPLIVEGDLDKLQWSVSKTTNEIYEYKDVENNSTPLSWKVRLSMYRSAGLSGQG